jgi:hypothetical protein
MHWLLHKTTPVLSTASVRKIRFSTAKALHH